MNVLKKSDNNLSVFTLLRFCPAQVIKFCYGEKKLKEDIRNFSQKCRVNEGEEEVRADFFP